MSIITNSALLSPFNPRQIPGGVLWLDSPDPAATGVRPANASALATFVDQFKKSGNFTQATGANQPIFNLNQIKGLPTVDFALAGPNFMSSAVSAMPTGSAARTIFLVVNFNTVATQQYVFSQGTPSVPGLGLSIGISAALPIIAFGNTTLFTGSTTIVAGVTYIFSLIYPSGGQAWDTVFKINGAVQTASGVNGSVNTSSVAPRIGKNIATAPASPSDCQFCQLLAYNSALNAASENAVYQYLKQRWQ